MPKEYGIDKPDIPLVKAFLERERYDYIQGEDKGKEEWINEMLKKSIE